MQKYAYYACPYGWVEIGYEDEKIVSISSKEEQKPGPNQEGVHSELSDRAFAQLSEYFEGKRRTFDLPLKLNGTKFQVAVWRALLDIPYGETRSYQEIASAVGNPKACRAVGMANRNNPIWIVVPCHRVIGADGRLTGYAGGVEMKRSLLELEQKGRKRV